MNCTERDNYFSIYMKRKENLNKSKKNIFGKSNRTLKNSNVSNLNIHNEKSVKKLIFETSGKKERSSISYIRNNLFNNKNKEIITSDKNDDFLDDDDKIDYLQKKIFGILDIIDNFKAKFFINNEKEIEKKEVKKNNNSKSNPKQLKHIKTNYRVISNIENRQNIFMTNNYNNNNNTQPKNIFIKKNNNNHPKSNSQLVSEQKIKETLLKRRIDYSNSINKKIIKKENNNIVQKEEIKNLNSELAQPKIIYKTRGDPIRKIYKRKNKEKNIDENIKNIKNENIVNLNDNYGKKEIRTIIKEDTLNKKKNYCCKLNINQTIDNNEIKKISFYDENIRKNNNDESIYKCGRNTINHIESYLKNNKEFDVKKNNELRRVRRLNIRNFYKNKNAII